MMRPKVFHGTNSITCANSVLPTFMRHSRSSNPESIANEPHAIQIVDTLNSMEIILGKGLAGSKCGINRTAVARPIYLVDSAKDTTGQSYTETYQVRYATYLTDSTADIYFGEAQVQLPWMTFR